MPELTIRTENLGKLYRIGAVPARYHTLRESIMDALGAARGLLQRAWRPGSAPQASAGNNTLWALKNVSLEVPQGDILGLVGRNGAGKTTLLKVLSRITEPTTGRVELRGRVGSLLEVGTGFHPELTGRENIFLNGAILGMSRREIQARFDEIVAFAEIDRFIDTPLKRYSTGMGTRLAFAIAAHLDTEILLVDEVLAVGDLGFRTKCLGKMKDVTREGRTVIFVSHEMNAIRRLCQRAVWLDQGEVQATGEVQEVVAQYEASFRRPDGALAARVERTNPPHTPKWFSWVSLADAKGELATAFKYGDTLRLTIGMEGCAPKGIHFIDWTLYERSQGIRLGWGNTFTPKNVELQKDSIVLTFNIGPIPLSKGTYSFSLAMGVAGIIDLDLWSDAIGFEVYECMPEGHSYEFTTISSPIFIPYDVRL